jgi:hypothetical protein
MPQQLIKARGLVGWPTDGFTTAQGHHQSKDWRWMGSLVASTWVRKHHGHLDPRSSLDWSMIRGFSLKKGNEPSRPVERTS